VWHPGDSANPDTTKATPNIRWPLFIRWAVVFESKAAAKRPQFSACLKTWRSLFKVKSLLSKQRFLVSRFSGLNGF
jgi:hypothetical protein